MGGYDVLLPDAVLIACARRHGYIAPKRPYSFDDMMMDVLDFSYLMLVDNARLCMWMPTANDDDIELAIPTHPGLKLISVSVQPFNKCLCC